MSFFSKPSGANNISAQEAYKRMGETDKYILLDVRTPQEFAQVRIKGAKLIPLDQLGSRAAAEVPDKDALIFVYCQSGARSTRAAGMLANMGYTAVANFGGIMDWPYETERG